MEKNSTLKEYDPCCYISQEGKSCGREAKWFIVYGSAPTDFTFACTKHLGYLLGDEPYFQVWPIIESK